MRKFRKLIKHPGIFFRDYLEKKYPRKNIEQPFFEYDEKFVIEYEEVLNNIENRNLCYPSEPIDVVFTWVNDKDDEWQKKVQYHLHNVQEQFCELSTNIARFENRNELFFSVNSVRKWMPWVNHIYIVTDGQIPYWLGEDEKITIVDHKTIIDEKYLPTFNSHVIEAHLHRIPELNENFIYFNDDVFVARELNREHFFHRNGIASIFLSDKSLDSMKNKGTRTPTLSASENSKVLLEKKYICSVDTPLVHTYVPLKKSIYELCWSMFSENIEMFLSNRFRGKNDLNLATFLVPWMMYLEGKSVLGTEICYYFNVRSNQAKSYYQRLLEQKRIGHSPHSFCANDFTSTKCVEGCEEKFISFMQEYFK